MYFGIGVFQCLSMIPGVSRAGATIVGAMLFGADRRSAAEFSFWLAMPTMVGAFAFEAFKNRADLAHGDLTAIAVGFVFSFIFGWIVVKTFLRYVQRHTLRAVRLVAHRGRHHRHLRDLFYVNRLRRVTALTSCILEPVHALRVTQPAAELAGLAEAPKIGRHDRLDRLRLDAEPLQRAAFGDRAASDTTLSTRSSSTWSGVSSGVGMNCSSIALSLATKNGSGTSSRLRSMVAST